MDRQPTRHIINRLRKLSTTLLLLTCFELFASVHFPLPENHQSIYSVQKYGAEVGEIESQFQRQGTHIDYTSTATATGITALFFNEVITENSQLYWPDDESLQSPQQLSYTLQHKKKDRKDQRISFIWNEDTQVTVSSTYKGKTTTLTSEQRVWSSQMLSILMSHHLLENKDTKQQRFMVANKGHLKHYTFTLLNSEDIKLNDGTYNCLKFKMQKQDSSRVSHVWLSKEHFYLPLKIEQYDDDSDEDELDVSMTLKHFKLLK